MISSKEGPAREGRAGRRPIRIAIDGTAAAGKGTLGRALARATGFAYLETGLLYRAVALRLLEEGREGTEASAEAALEAARSLRPGDLARGRDLRGEAVGLLASKAAAWPQVRAALRDWQRQFIAAPPAPSGARGGPAGVILEGRDIGTVIMPDAEIKIFLTASAEVRARRRLAELRQACSRQTGRHAPLSFQEVLADLKRRDRQDATRAVAPLKAARDAHKLDTSALSADEVLERALALVRPFLPERGAAERNKTARNPNAGAE